MRVGWRTGLEFPEVFGGIGVLDSRFASASASASACVTFRDILGQSKMSLTQ